MPLRDRDVDRLADHRTGVVHGRRHVGELVELVEVGERAVAPLVVEVVDERRAVSRRECDLVAADLGIALGIARVHREAARVLADQRHQQLARDPHPEALDLGAGVPPHLSSLGVAELDPDLLEDRERGLVDQLEAFLVQHLIDRDAARQHRQRADLDRGPGLTPGRAPATSSLVRRCGHPDRSLLLAARPAAITRCAWLRERA